MPTTSPTQLKGHLAPKGDLEGFVANGEWFYTWPHGEIPFVIADLNMTSRWTDESSHHGGRTAQNWGKPLVFESKSSKVSIWIERDYHRTIINPVGVEDWGDWSQAGFRSVKFHDRPLVMAKIEKTNGDEQVCILLALRIGDRLFRIQAEGKDGTNVYQDAFACTEAIFRFRGEGQKNSTSQPSAQAIPE
jgi:hypothetical protein